MRFGFETVLWGRRIDDLDYTLEVIARCGYEGVEFSQHPSQIFVRDGEDVRPLRDVEEMLALLHKHGLELIGLVEGSLHERMNFLQGHTEAYLYLDR